MSDDPGQRSAPGEFPRSQDVHREVAVAQSEPVLAPQGLEDAHHRPGLVPATPTLLRVGEIRERVEHRIDIRADAKAQVREVVAGVHDERQSAARQGAV